LVLGLRDVASVTDAAIAMAEVRDVLQGFVRQQAAGFFPKLSLDSFSPVVIYCLYLPPESSVFVAFFAVFVLKLKEEANFPRLVLEKRNQASSADVPLAVRVQKPKLALDRNETKK